MVSDLVSEVIRLPGQVERHIDVSFVCLSMEKERHVPVGTAAVTFIATAKSRNPLDPFPLMFSINLHQKVGERHDIPTVTGTDVTEHKCYWYMTP